MATETVEIKASILEQRVITLEAMAKVPTQKWEEIAGEPSPVVTISLTIKDISDRDLRRLAQAALSKIPLDVEIIPRVEQTEFTV